MTKTVTNTTAASTATPAKKRTRKTAVAKKATTAKATPAKKSTKTKQADIAVDLTNTYFKGNGKNQNMVAQMTALIEAKTSTVNGKILGGWGGKRGRLEVLRASIEQYNRFYSEKPSGRFPLIVQKGERTVPAIEAVMDRRYQEAFDEANANGDLEAPAETAAA